MDLEAPCRWIWQLEEHSRAVEACIGWFSVGLGCQSLQLHLQMPEALQRQVVLCLCSPHANRCGRHRGLGCKLGPPYLQAPCRRSGRWTRIPGLLKHVSVGPRWVWGVNRNDYIYKCQRPCTGRWSLVSGRLMQINVGDTEVWGVNSAHRIYKLPADGSGRWTRVPGSLKHVSVGPRWVWGVNRYARIYKSQRPWAGRWYGMQMQLDVGNTDVGNTDVEGVNSTDVGNTDVGNTDVEGVNSTHMIYP